MGARSLSERFGGAELVDYFEHTPPVGTIPEDVADYAQRGLESRYMGKSPKTRAELNAASRKTRAATLEELRINKKLAGALMASCGTTDLFVVSRADLAEIVAPWVERENAEVSNNGTSVGGLLYLASEIGCHPDVIRNVLTRGGPWVSFGLADELLVALDCPMAFQDGRVPVYVNPRMSFKRWCKRAAEEDIDCPAEMWLEYSHPEAWAA